MPSETNRAEYNRNDWKSSRPGSLRFRVFTRDAWRCRLCGELGKQKGGTATLTLHHLRPRGGSVMSNLLTLCRPCHGRVDGPRARRPRRGRRSNG